MKLRGAFGDRRCLHWKEKAVQAPLVNLYIVCDSPENNLHFRFTDTKHLREVFISVMFTVIFFKERLYFLHFFKVSVFYMHSRSMLKLVHFVTLLLCAIYAQKIGETERFGGEIDIISAQLAY